MQHEVARVGFLPFVQDERPLAEYSTGTLQIVTGTVGLLLLCRGLIRLGIRLAQHRWKFMQPIVQETALQRPAESLDHAVGQYQTEALVVRLDIGNARPQDLLSSLAGSPQWVVQVEAVLNQVHRPCEDEARQGTELSPDNKAPQSVVLAFVKSAFLSTPAIAP
eukprot:CAMPEP_0176020162 /NCGR_PEP_ID=MMETSP0120_2-20121206/9760_1 /TAXON_ID=160619 /ORGANISM="Kryptoperidinium foliaceum, Strain CCMP 1326" /LENGTH=163 /DNA_ID=CAMNT_0017353253 /DNA_START=334 /DNA_END=822 /DNA_ORIENTATION=+